MTTMLVLLIDQEERPEFTRIRSHAIATNSDDKDKRQRELYEAAFLAEMIGRWHTGKIVIPIEQKKIIAQIAADYAIKRMEQPTSAEPDFMI